MNEKQSDRNVAPIELPPPPDPRPQDDPLTRAVIAEILENGFDPSRRDAVVERAGVPGEEFDRRFESLEHCALDSFERMSADFMQQVGTAFNDQPEWPTALRAAAYATTDWLVENPELASYGLVGVLGLPDEMVRVRREESLEFCGLMIDRGREVAPDPEAIPASAPTFAIGTITQLLTHRQQEEATVDPPALVPEMMFRIVSIYLGPEAAEREWKAERPPPRQLVGR